MENGLLAVVLWVFYDLSRGCRELILKLYPVVGVGIGMLIGDRDFLARE